MQGGNRAEVGVPRTTGNGAEMTPRVGGKPANHIQPAGHLLIPHGAFSPCCTWLWAREAALYLWTPGPWLSSGTGQLGALTGDRAGERLGIYPTGSVLGSL